MFAKQAPKTGAASGGHGAPRRASKAPSMIAADMVLQGAVVSEGDLHIDGLVRGDIRVGQLTLGESGVVEGDIHAENVEARGRIAGSITARIVRLLASAHVEGDITHEQLSMEPGAAFEGRALRLKPAGEAPVAEILSLPSAAAGA